MNVNYYSYRELADAALADASEKNLAALGEWFDRFGRDFWDGLCYKVTDRYNLYPIYEHHYDEDGELDCSLITGWELR